MNLGTAVVLLIVMAICGFSLRSIFKKGGTCGCEGGCEGCGNKCSCNVDAMVERLESDVATR